MHYDFTSLMDRRGKDAIAVDGVGGPGAPGAPKAGFDVIPMWVADMNFPVAPSIQAALLERIQHPVFGYFDPPDAYFDTIIRWQETHRSQKRNCTPIPNFCIGIPFTRKQTTETAFIP